MGFSLGVGKELLLGSFSHLPHVQQYKRGSVPTSFALLGFLFFIFVHFVQETVATRSVIRYSTLCTIWLEANV